MAEWLGDELMADEMDIADWGDEEFSLPLLLTRGDIVTDFNDGVLFSTAWVVIGVWGPPVEFRGELAFIRFGGL